MSVALIEVAPDHLIQLLAELSVHLRLAHESLEHEKESLENFDVLYTTSEAKTIVELTANVIKSIIDSKAEVVTFIALRDPAIIVNNFNKNKNDILFKMFTLGMDFKVFNFDEISECCSYCDDFRGRRRKIKRN